MKRKSLLVWAIALLCLSVSASAQTVIYVSSNGSDVSGTGSATAPYKTIDKAVGLVKNNVETVIYVEENATFEVGALDLGESKKVTIIGRNTTFLAQEKPGHEGGLNRGNRILRAAANCDLTVKGIIFRNGRQVEYHPGGAIYFAGNVLTVDSCRFYGNEAGSAGGAIGARGRTVIVRNSYFEDNWVTGGGGWGGAISQVGLRNTSGCSLTVENCTFYRQRMESYDPAYPGGAGQGMAIALRDGGVADPKYTSVDLVKIVNCTFVENTSAYDYQAAIDITTATSETMTYVVNNTFYGNDGAVQIGVSYGDPNVFLVNNVMFANLSGVSASSSVADGRQPIVAYNNLIVGGETGVNQHMDDECLNAQVGQYRNVIATSTQYSPSGVSLSTTLSDTWVPYLAITSATSALVDAGLDNSETAIGLNLVPVGDVRGGAAYGVKDIGAYEWNAIVSSIRNPATDRADGFELIRATDGLEVRNLAGGNAQLMVYDIVGSLIYTVSVHQSVFIGKGVLKQGIAVFTLRTNGDTFVKKVSL
jgi:hypothetical protein